MSEDNFLQQPTSYFPLAGVILSWDEDTGTGGTCHVSARSQRHVANTFSFLGDYRLDREATNILR